MILLIDNYDSFSYNLYQLIGSLDADIKVVRNDVLTPEDILAMNPSSPASVWKPYRSLPEKFPFWAYVWDIRQSARHLAPKFPMQRS